MQSRKSISHRILGIEYLSKHHPGVQTNILAVLKLPLMLNVMIQQTECIISNDAINTSML